MDVLNDIFNEQMKMLGQDELVDFFGIRTNLLKYGSIEIKIHTFLKKLGILNIQIIREIGSINTYTNGIITMYSKIVSGINILIEARIAH